MSGSGYTSANIGKYFLDECYQIIVVDNLIGGNSVKVDKHVVFKHVDLLDNYFLSQVFHKFKIDAVIHFADYAYRCLHLKTFQGVK